MRARQRRDSPRIGERCREARRIGDVARERAELIERLAENVSAGKGNRVLRRLVPDDAAIGGGPDHRAVGLRADRAGDLSRSDGGRGPRRRSARRVLRVPGISRLRRVEKRKRRRHRLAEDESARVLQPRDAGGVLLRAVARVDGRAQLHRLVDRRNDVLDGDADSVERPSRHPLARVAHQRFGAHAQRIEVRPCADRGVGRGDPRKFAFGERAGGDRAGGDRVGGRGERPAEELLPHGAPRPIFAEAITIAERAAEDR